MKKAIVKPCKLHIWYGYSEMKGIEFEVVEETDLSLRLKLPKNMFGHNKNEILGFNPNSFHVFESKE